MQDSLSPPGSNNFSLTLLRKEVDKKADENWARAKFEALDSDNSDSKKIALAALDKANKPHQCVQLEVIKEMKEAIGEISRELTSWKNVRIGGIISVGVIIVGIIGSFFAQKANLESTSKTVVEMKQIVDIVDVAQRTLKEDIEQERLENERKDIERERKQLTELKSLMKSAVNEAWFEKNR